ncbi:serine hydrolase domain-containing protein [Niabella beijingensis]|uniref:serine hydrolase domain-containing protein n=1 Tax=Niabella beijingensis TaxID=2872700 RepID=UPI001CBEB5CF|nr:serine hydrolase domain-containing protein [Niabella beijingensis]MBZ4189125.1 beta-lactamase family protein [Niabella beijingensis]
MKRIRLLFIGIALQLTASAQSKVLVPGTAAANGFSGERLQRIDRVIQEYVQKNWIKGATALIAHNGVIVYNKAFGLNNAQSGTPLKSNDIFRIASQTKAITSVAVMMLFEEGKFLLDDPISKFIPSFARPKVLDQFNAADSSYTTVPAKREITIRDLLTHTSGLDYAQIGSPNMKAIYAKAGLEAGFVIKPQKLADAIDRLGTLPLVHQPGERFTYGLNTDVLGRLVEVVSGKSLDAFFHERIFGPLGMQDTYFQLPQAKQSRLVSVYTEDRTTKAVIPWSDTTFRGVTIDYPVNNNGYFAGGAGLVSTTADYATFLQMLVNKGVYNGKQLLSRHTVDLMTRNQIGDLMLGNNKFGLGFEITTEKGAAKLGQSAGSFAWGGFFGTSYWGDPKENIVALLFVQQWPFSHGEINDKFKALVYQALK